MRHEKRQSKGLESASEASYILLIWECQEIFQNLSLWQNYSVAQLHLRRSVQQLEDEAFLFWMSLQLLGPTVSPGGNFNALNPCLKGTSQWCTVLYYNVHSNIYRCAIMLSSGLFIRMSRKDLVKLLPSQKACNILRCYRWKWVTDAHQSSAAHPIVLCRSTMGGGGAEQWI